MSRTKSILIASAFAMALTMPAAPAAADVRQLSFYTKGELDQKCADNGGTPVGGAAVYGCTKACGTGKCGVMCEAETKTCLGSTPRVGRPVVTGDRGLVGTLNATLREEDDGDDHGRGKDGVPWGLLGLAGLLGLLGMKRDRGPVAGRVNR